MSNRSDAIAKIIFDWFNREEADGAPPYTFNEDADKLTVGVDGYLDCRKLADAIDAALPQEQRP